MDCCLEILGRVKGGGGGTPSLGIRPRRVPYSIMLDFSEASLLIDSRL